MHNKKWKHVKKTALPVLALAMPFFIAETAEAEEPEAGNPSDTPAVTSEKPEAGDPSGELETGGSSDTPVVTSEETEPEGSSETPIVVVEGTEPADLSDTPVVTSEGTEQGGSPETPAVVVEGTEPVDLSDTPVVTSEGTEQGGSPETPVVVVEGTEPADPSDTPVVIGEGTEPIGLPEQPAAEWVEPNESDELPDAAAEEIETADSAEPLAAAAPVCPTYKEAYEKMIALKDEYPEGMYWTNFGPYSSSNVYKFKGGEVKGATGGIGCVAFAYILSDKAFGDLPIKGVIDKGGFKFEDIKVGDILRINGNSHSVIVLQTSAGGVTVAEGNYNKSVHWGRVMSKEEVENADYIITRYPENFVPSDSADFDKVEANGTEGSLNWSLTRGGTLTISGSGAIPDFDNNNKIPSWKTHNDVINTIVIENGVTGIGNYAFYQSKAVTVYIPEGITNIGQSAFRESAIMSVTIPDTVTAIENDAFRECPNLVTATVSEGVKTIGERAFYGCTALRSIDFPASITKVGAGAFTSCENMTRVRFMPGTGKVELGDNLFTQCWHLTDVTLPQTADRISAGMFQSCSSLSKIYIPAGVGEIGDKAFTQCYSLQSDGIYFGSSEAKWNSIGGKAAIITLQPYIVTVHYDVEFEDPFVPKDGEVDEPSPVEPEKPEEPEPGEHKHSWSADWNRDDANHWHECGNEDCPVADNAQKDHYEVHNYGDWVITINATALQDGSKYRDCVVCSYRQTESIPAVGSPSDPGKPGEDPGTNPEKPGINPGKPGGSNDVSASDSSSGWQQFLKNQFEKPFKEQLETQLKEQVEIQIKEQLETQLKEQVETQIKEQLETQIKEQLGTQIKEQLETRIKEQLGTQFKEQFKTQFKEQFETQFKEQFETQFKEQFGKQFKEQFEKLFKEQFEKLFNEQFEKLFNEQFEKLFNEQFEKLFNEQFEKLLKE